MVKLTEAQLEEAADEIHAVLEEESDTPLTRGEVVNVLRAADQCGYALGCGVDAC